MIAPQISSPQTHAISGIVVHPAQIRPAPRTGLATGSIGVDDAGAKDHDEKVLREHVGQSIASGQIDPKSIVSARIFAPHD
jgi:hypothetical protein